jgi:2,3-dihydroxybenzoate decarboxylase
VQAIPDRKRAIEVAKKANDYLAEQVAKNPKRFQAFAALPMQDPEAATREYERCMKELNFVGALVNGFSQVDDPNSAVYLDQAQYWDFWGVVEKLGYPFYLHPRNPLPSMAQIYEGHKWLLGPTWAFGQETAVHALRLMGSGLFDKYPGLKIVLGHLGEGLPYSIWRVDNRNAWTKAKPNYRAQKKIGEYFQKHFWLTTSGNFRTQTLIDAMLEIGSDRILFSADWPFENVDHAAVWFDNATISELDRQKIGRQNAAELFKLRLNA